MYDLHDPPLVSGRISKNIDRPCLLLHKSKTHKIVQLSNSRAINIHQLAFQIPQIYYLVFLIS